MASTNATKLGRQDIINEVAKNTGLTKKDVAAVVNASLDAIADALKKGNNVSFIGFGSFKVQKVKARKGNNIVTKEPIKIPAHKRVKFTAGKTLADAVRNSKK